jgi:CRP-like cAMP-binding protein
MRIVVVIPTYWAREKKDMWREGDAVYDHPTPIDGEETLSRTLESMKILNNKNFKLVIPICTTHSDVNARAKERVKQIVENVGLTVETYLFDETSLSKVEMIIDNPVTDFLNIRGYSNVRNICLFIGHIMSSDISILIDDDEVFEDADFIDKSITHVGKRIYGRSVYGVAGFYLNKYDEFYDDVEIVPWMTYWNRFGSKSKAFDKIIRCDPRLKVTPFAFGGLMVLHKNLYRVVPFDSGITRGEDIDYLINAKMFGFDFFLDNQLSIKHLPPKKHHPIWKRLREDLYRFLYEQAKIRSQYEVINMTQVSENEFDPYPGEFFKEDLEDKIFKTNILLALDYLSHGNVEGCQESLKNIYLSKYEAKPKEDPFTNYRTKQKSWTTLMTLVSEHRMGLRRVLEDDNLSKYRLKEKVPVKELTREEVVQKLKRFDDFSGFNNSELLELAKDAFMCSYDTDEVIFKKGDQQMRLSLIISGCVRIINFNSQNEEIPIGMICSGGVLGETVLLRKQYNVHAIANEPVEVLCFEKEVIENIIQSNPIIGNKVLYILLDRIYYKLRVTSQNYEDKLLMEEDLSTRN